MLTNADGVLVYEANITHNLNHMAEAAGIYQHVWRPEEIGITKAADLIKPLERGVAEMEAEPERFEQFNAANAWGKYRDFLPWLRSYLEACRANPDATVSVYR